MNTACMSSKLVTHSSINAAAADETNDLIGYFFPAMRQLPQQSTPQYFELLSAGAALIMRLVRISRRGPDPLPRPSGSAHAPLHHSKPWAYNTKALPGVPVPLFCEINGLVSINYM